MYIKDEVGKVLHDIKKIPTTLYIVKKLHLPPKISNGPRKCQTVLINTRQLPMMPDAIKKILMILNDSGLLRRY